MITSIHRPRADMAQIEDTETKPGGAWIAAAVALAAAFVAGLLTGWALT